MQVGRTYTKIDICGGTIQTTLLANVLSYDMGTGEYMVDICLDKLLINKSINDHVVSVTFKECLRKILERLQIYGRVANFFSFGSMKISTNEAPIKDEIFPLSFSGPIPFSPKITVELGNKLGWLERAKLCISFSLHLRISTSMSEKIEIIEAKQVGTDVVLLTNMIGKTLPGAVGSFNPNVFLGGNEIIQGIMMDFDSGKITLQGEWQGVGEMVSIVCDGQVANCLVK